MVELVFSYDYYFFFYEISRSLLFFKNKTIYLFFNILAEHGKTKSTFFIRS